MYSVKQAVIVAAGKGERMLPLTKTVPKPLIEVNGRPMIETIIDGLHANGITNIYVVVGYRKEQFRYLTDRYDGVTLIDNPYFDTSNNIASLYMARDHLEESIILDGDLIIRNQDILKPAFSVSGYNAVWNEKETREWLLNVKDGRVQSCSRTGGNRGWQLYSISRWTPEDGRKLKQHLEELFSPGKQSALFWDDIPLFCHPEAYALGINEMCAEDVAEVDTAEELLNYNKHFAGTYRDNGDTPACSQM